MSSTLVSSGLTRRRAGNSTATTSRFGNSVDVADSHSVSQQSTITSPSTSRRNADESIIPETAYENHAAGHKIAYDVRDLVDSAHTKKLPKLTLMEEVLLLGLKDKQGYLSFWNDNISYALRGCIVIELAFRGRISMQKDPGRRRFPLPDRIIEVIDDTLTGEVLLDEALKMMKSSEKMSVSSWIDLLSGETWNLMKIGYQLKQVRERLAKGLVDKGILCTEKRNFLLFDMATHPVVDTLAKDDIRQRVQCILCSRNPNQIVASSFFPADIEFRHLRTIAMICAAYAANVLENALSSIRHDARERAFALVDQLLNHYSQWPFTRATLSRNDPSMNGSNTLQPSSSPTTSPASSTYPRFNSSLELAIQDEVAAARDRELQLEVVAACFNVFTRLDSLL